MILFSIVPLLAKNGCVQQHHAIAFLHEVIPSLHHLKIQCVLNGVYTVEVHVCSWFAQQKYGRIVKGFFRFFWRGGEIFRKILAFVDFIMCLIYV